MLQPAVEIKQERITNNEDITIVIPDSEDEEEEEPVPVLRPEDEDLYPCLRCRLYLQQLNQT